MKPPALAFKKPPAETDAFVFGGDKNAQGPKRSSAQAPESPSSTGRRTIERKDGRELRRIGIYFPSELARELAVYAAQEDRELSEIVVEYVRRGLKGSGT